jgi:hypothetical protein
MHDSMRTALSARRAQSLHACAGIWYNVHRKPSSAEKMKMASAGVAQLVEYLPSKQAVAGSSPVSRSKYCRFLMELFACSDLVRNER